MDLSLHQQTLNLDDGNNSRVNIVTALTPKKSVKEAYSSSSFFNVNALHNPNFNEGALVKVAKDDLPFKGYKQNLHKGTF